MFWKWGEPSASCGREELGEEVIFILLNLIWIHTNFYSLHSVSRRNCKCGTRTESPRSSRWPAGEGWRQATTSQPPWRPSSRADQPSSGTGRWETQTTVSNRSQPCAVRSAPPPEFFLTDAVLLSRPRRRQQRLNSQEVVSVCERGVCYGWVVVLAFEITIV